MNDARTPEELKAAYPSFQAAREALRWARAKDDRDGLEKDEILIQEWNTLWAMDTW